MYGCSVGELVVARCNVLVKVDVVALVSFHKVSCRCLSSGDTAMRTV